MVKEKGAVRKAISSAYSVMFGKKPGPFAERFMKNLGYIFIGLALAKVFSLAFEIMTGRLLGPADYGKFTLIISISQFLYVPMLLGIGTALVKYLAEQKTEESRREVISTGLILMSASVLAFAAFFVLASPYLTILTAASLDYVVASVAVAVLYSIWVVSQKILQGLDKIKRISTVNIVWSAVILAYAAVSFMYTRSAMVPIVAICLGYVISSLLVMPELRRYLRPRISRRWSKTLLKYGMIATLAGISASITGNINKILINIFLSLEEVGIYQAYYFSSINIIAFFVTVIVTIFFPMASRYADKKLIFGQVNRLSRAMPLIFLASSAISFVMLLLYGGGYPIIWPLILMFSVWSSLVFIQSLYNWFASSIGIGGAKITTMTVVIISLMNLALSYLVIPYYGIYGAVGSSIISYACGLCFIYKRTKTFLKQQQETFNGRKEAVPWTP